MVLHCSSWASHVNCVAPRIQASPCLCPKTTDLLKGMVNPPYFFCTVGMYFTYSHLYTERKDVLGVFSAKQKKMWGSVPAHHTREKTGCWVTLQQTQPWAYARERELRLDNNLLHEFLQAPHILFRLDRALRTHLPQAQHTLLHQVWGLHTVCEVWMFLCKVNEK